MYIINRDGERGDITEILKKRNIGKTFKMFMTTTARADNCFSDDEIFKRIGKEIDVYISKNLDILTVENDIPIQIMFSLREIICFTFIESKKDIFIDWRKVPQFTKVQVKNNKNDKWENRYFNKIDNRCIAKYKTYRELPDNFTKFKPLSNENFSFIRLHPDVKLNKNWCA